MKQIWIVERLGNDGQHTVIAAFAKESDARACAAREDIHARRDSVAKDPIEVGLDAWHAKNPRLYLSLSLYAEALQAERERLQAENAVRLAAAPGEGIPPIPQPTHQIRFLPFFS